MPDITCKKANSGIDKLMYEIYQLTKNEKCD